LEGDLEAMNGFQRLVLRVLALAKWLSTAGAILAAIVFLAMTLLTLSEVVLRTSAGRSTLIASEYSGYALSAMVYLSLGFTFSEGAHIRITFLNDALPKAAKRWLEVILLSAATFVMSVASTAVWQMVVTTRQRGTVAYTPAETPLYIPQAIMLLGLVIFLWQLVANLLGNIAFADLNAVQQNDNDSEQQGETSEVIA
jgi:TRAP-type C4-dicarboxylate transport system permease small subunit